MADNTKKYIKKINIGSSTDPYYIKDEEAVHSVATINGDAIADSSSDLSLANTPIPTTEIESLFN